MYRTALIAVIAFSLTACGGSRSLHRFDDNLVGPDEFRVQPSLPLQMPETTALPAPTPGGSNITDRNPEAEAIIALGGRPDSDDGAVPARDQALVNAAFRNGVDPSIRQTLAEEDAAFRRRAGALAGGRGSERYFRAYARYALDAYAELERFRALGVAVPTAPPAE